MMSIIVFWELLRKTKREPLGVDLDDFVFVSRCRHPERVRAEINELSRKGYITVRDGVITRDYKMFHWFGRLVARVLKYVVFHVAVPVGVALLISYFQN